MKNDKPYLILSIISAVMLLLALADWPYGYYQLLRFVVCGTAAYIAYLAYDWKRIGAVWLFGFVALLFNPFIPIHLSRELWQPIDIISALLFIAVTFVIKKPEQEEKTNRDST